MRPDPKPRKLENGRWKARVGLWDPASQRIARQLTRTFDYKWQAEEWIRDQRGRTLDADRVASMTLARYVETYEAEIMYGLRSPQTEANYRGHLSLRIVPELGRVKVGELDAAMVERAQARWSVNSSRTVVVGTRNCLSRVCRLAVKQGGSRYYL